MNQRFLNRWFIFINERFSPLNYTLLISSFLFGNSMLAVQTMKGFSASNSMIALTAIVVFLIFFHLRLFDERKDYEIDLKIHPERPLARGVVKIEEVGRVGGVVIFLELLLACFISAQAFLGVMFVVGFSLLMLKEFFVGSWMRPKMELYAITHTFVSVFMSLFVFSSITSLYIWQIPVPGLIFALDAWLIFTIFEFARKTYAPDEEKSGIDSYSKRLGKFGVVFIVALLAALSFFLVFTIGGIIQIPNIYFYALLFLFVVFILLSFLYVAFSGIIHAKMYRASVNFYMLIFYLVLGLAILFKDKLL